MTFQGPNYLQTAEIMANAQDMLAIVDNLHFRSADAAVQTTADLLYIMVLGVLECWSVGVLQKTLSCEVLFRRSITPILQYSITP